MIKALGFEAWLADSQRRALGIGGARTPRVDRPLGHLDFLPKMISRR